MDCCPNPKRSTAAVPRLPEDAVLEILARLPARSVHRFKCVSQRWCDLIADPVHRKRLPQTLEGFFCSDAENYYYGEFISLPGITAPLLDPSFSFLTKLPGCKNIRLLHSCHGLILFGHGAGGGIDGKFGYIVCNPATEQWLAVPGAGIPSPQDCTPAYIIFDPAVSSHFHLFCFWQNDNQGVIEVRTYYNSLRMERCRARGAIGGRPALLRRPIAPAAACAARRDERAPGETSPRCTPRRAPSLPLDACLAPPSYEMGWTDATAPQRAACVAASPGHG
ncbi:unnamed protein product [Urochloa humidicola]